MKQISHLWITAAFALLVNQVAFGEPNQSKGKPESTPEGTPNGELIQRPIPAPSEDKDPFPIDLPPPPPRRSGESPPKLKLKLSPSPLPNFPTNNDNAPIDDEGNLLIDATFGLKGETSEAQEKKVKSRLAAVAFAINSVNTSKTKLLKVDEMMKSLFPPNGKFKKDQRGAAKVRLAAFLTDTQISALRTALSKEPLNCAKNRFSQPGRRVSDEDERENPDAEPLRADVIAKAMLDQTNYYELLGLTDSRRDFERDLGIPREFDVDGDRKDLSDNTLRILLKPGQSGITHSNTQRLIVLHKTASGRLVVRTGDVDKSEGSKPERNFIQRPATARPSGSEEIWELPNGMRAYSARNAAGALLKQVPHGLVTTEITNSTCFECHGGHGYIAGSGKFDGPKHTSEAPLKRTRVVPEDFGERSFGNNNLFKAEWKDYMDAIAPANARYKVAKEANELGAANALAILNDYNKDSSVKDLAKELDVDDEEIRSILLARRVRSSWDPDFDSTDKKDQKKEIPELSRSTLETEVDIGKDGNKRIKRPLFCVLRDTSGDQFTKAKSRELDSIVGKPLRKPGPGKATHDQKI